MAAATAFGATQQATRDKVEDDQFGRVAVINCQGINELRDVLRDILATAPRTNPESERFLGNAVAKLVTKDCSKLVDP